MSEADFRLLYLCELEALGARYQATQLREDARIANLCSVIANFSMTLDRKKYPQGLSPAFFMGKERPQKPRVQTEDEQFAIFDRLTKRLNG